ncbi:MAG: MAPEG family protein [Bacillota bacterium]
MTLAYLAILAMVAEYAFFAYMVGVARGRYRLAAPAVSGNPDFERYFRVQQNTIEQLVMVIPCTFIFAATWNPLWAALLGFGFVLSRLQYAYGYYKSAPGRHWGFVWGSVFTAMLGLGAGIGVVKELF